MSFLAICLPPSFLLVVNEAVKRRLAVIRLVSCLQTVQMKMFHNSIVILHILSVGLLSACRFSLPKKIVEASQNRCICFVLFGNYTHLRSYAQKAKRNVRVFILEIKHIMVPLVCSVTVLLFKVSFIILLTFSLFVSLFSLSMC